MSVKGGFLPVCSGIGIRPQLTFDACREQVSGPFREQWPIGVWLGATWGVGCHLRFGSALLVYVVCGYRYRNRPLVGFTNELSEPLHDDEIQVVRAFNNLSPSTQDELVKEVLRQLRALAAFDY
jgi:hypothetical protein